MNAVDKMSVEQLKECLKILYDMELNNYLMLRSNSQIVYRANQLGYRPKRNAPTMKENTTDPLDIIGGVMAITATLGAVFTGLSGCSGGGNIIEQALSFFDVIAGAIIGGIVGGLVGIPIGIITYFIVKAVKNDENKQIYNSEYYEYSNTIKNDEHIYNIEIKQKEMLLQQSNILISRYKEADIKLKSFYDMAGMDEKFRNLIAIGYMYEFIRLGISKRIDGTDGLYYLTMKELRWDQMQYTLQEISTKLDTIIDQNREIYGELIAMNQKCDNIVSSLNKLTYETARANRVLEANTSITAYNSERIKNELQYQNRMMMITG